MKKFKYLIVFVFICFSGITANAQETKVDSLAATEISNSAEKDPNIVIDEIVNSKADIKIKKGDSRGGGDCFILFDNHTPWSVNCYVNGEKVGMVSKYGEGTVNSKEGNIKVYCKVFFNDGSSRSWGPKTVYCGFGDKLEMKVYSEYYTTEVK